MQRYQFKIPTEPILPALWSVWPQRTRQPQAMSNYKSMCFHAGWGPAREHWCVCPWEDPGTLVKDADGVWEPPFQPAERLLNFPDINIVFIPCPQQKKKKKYIYIYIHTMERTVTVFLKVLPSPPIIEQSRGQGKIPFLWLTLGSRLGLCNKRQMNKGKAFTFI